MIVKCTQSSLAYKILLGLTSAEFFKPESRYEQGNQYFRIIPDFSKNTVVSVQAVRRLHEEMKLKTSQHR